MNKRLLLVVACLVVFLTACHIVPVSFREDGNTAPTASTTEDATATPAPTLTETPTTEPTATPELGGSEVAYLYDGRRIPMPEGVKSLLTPSDPEMWKQTGWYFTDGTPYPWGKPIEVGSGDQLLVVPFFVRGVVEIPEPLGHAGGKRIFVVLETPAYGGSNFVILNLQDNIYSTHPIIVRNYLVDGKVPVNWAQSSWGNPISVEDYLLGLTYTGTFTGKQITDELKQYVGKMVMVSFTPDPEYVGVSCLQQVAEGTLINQNGQSGVDVINPAMSVTLPYQSP